MHTQEKLTRIRVRPVCGALQSLLAQQPSEWLAASTTTRSASTITHPGELRKEKERKTARQTSTLPRERQQADDHFAVFVIDSIDSLLTYFAVFVVGIDLSSSRNNPPHSRSVAALNRVLPQCLQPVAVSPQISLHCALSVHKPHCTAHSQSTMTHLLRRSIDCVALDNAIISAMLRNQQRAHSSVVGTVYSAVMGTVQW